MGDIAINRLVKNIISDYDRNRNGVIDLSNGGRSENYHDVREQREQGNSTVITVTRYSYDALFLRADKNNDKKITADEITEVANEYDKDKNGKLSIRNFWEWVTGKPEKEIDVFNREIPEKSRIVSQHVIPHHPNHPPHFPNRKSN